MTYYTIKPSEKLADFVQYFWVFEGSVNPGQPFILRTPANGFAELLFHYKGIFNEVSDNHSTTSSFVSGVHGQTNRYRQFTISQDFGMIGVRLYPHALQTIFSIPAIEFTNNLPDLYSFLNSHDRWITQ